MHKLSWGEKLIPHGIIIADKKGGRMNQKTGQFEISKFDSFDRMNQRQFFRHKATYTKYLINV